MKLSKSIILASIVFSTTQIFAEKMLLPPGEQRTECQESYDEAPQPKIVTTIMSAMDPVCHRKGGLRVVHRTLTALSNEPAGMWFSCIGKTPDDILFSCSFYFSYEDL